MTLGTPPPPGAIRSSIDFRLRKGWSYDAQARVFVGPRGKQVEAAGLAADSRIEYKVPSLQEKAGEDLLPAERKLRAAMQVVLPRGERAEDYLEVVRRWEAVEDAAVAPQISLPSK